MVVEMSREILGPEYHNFIDDASSVSKARFEHIIERNITNISSGNSMLRYTVLFATIFFVLISPVEVKALELKTQYQNSYPKYFLSGTDTPKKVIGLCVEIIEAVEAELPDIKIVSDLEMDFMPFKRIQENLKRGSIDVFFGFAKNETRMTYSTFIDTPLYEVNHVMAVRRDDNVKINSFIDIRRLGKNGIVLTNFGTATEKFLKQQEGIIVDAGGFDTSMNIRKLLAGRGRFVYFHDIGLVSTIKRDFKKEDVKILPMSFKKYYHYVAFSKKTKSEIIEKFRKTIEKLSKNGVLNDISKKYQKFE